MTSIREKWISFTEETNALDFLERAYSFILETETDRTAWKWVVLSLHGSLYGFAISACRGTNYKDVIINRKGEERLISFDKALQYCQDQTRMHMLSDSNHLVLSESQKKSIKWLKKELRNNFEHYIPRGWSIEIHGLPKITIDVLDIIRFIAIETKTYMHLNQSQMNRVKSIIYRSKKFLMQSSLYKEAQLAEKLYKKRSNNCFEQSR